MWTYKQSTGELIDADGMIVATGYSGAMEGRNNPAMQERHNLGPIPQGTYAIGPPRDLQGGPHGPYVLPLIPQKGNAMWGRSGFLIHGDSVSNPGTASEGCIIMPRPIRNRINASGDFFVKVTA
jgi:hypothetical protein